jgi:hypothetical protein
MSNNLYAIDGKCHNSNRGSYGHECGKPAVWLGTRVETGFQSGFCDKCKNYGDERFGRTWQKHPRLVCK